MMLSDEEKQRIVERVEFEREVRANTEKKATPPRKSLWEALNSGLSILILGSLLYAIQGGATCLGGLLVQIHPGFAAGSRDR